MKDKKRISYSKIKTSHSNILFAVSKQNRLTNFAYDEFIFDDLKIKIFVSVNEKKINDYFYNIPSAEIKYRLYNLLTIYKTYVAKLELVFSVKVVGGGFFSQFKSVERAISNVLFKFIQDSINKEKKEILKSILRKNNLITVDSRKKERKKAGKHKARRSKQMSKR